MTMFYCEECGAKIIPGSRFCEECGTPVPEDEWVIENDECDKRKPSTQVVDSLFFHETWKNEWSSVAGCKGLIVINSEETTGLESFYDSLSNYICYSRGRGVDYHVLDINNQIVVHDSCDNSVYSIVDVLKQIYDVSKPDYLLIIGDEKSISDVSWENKSYDGDSYVFSDLPYLTFDCRSPFSQGSYSFSSDYVSVGRIPCSAGDNFATAVRYFDYVIHHGKTAENDCSFGLSAFVWKEESKVCFSPIGHRLLCSPDVTIEHARNKGIEGLSNGEKPSLLYFNLHGSDQTPYWYGQKEDRYPEVIDPKVIGDYTNGYFVGVEACYGAKYHDLIPEESILLTALNHGCLGFLGSSMIAYGSLEEPGCCADIIVREYLSCLKQGLSSGHAYLKALKKLCDSEIDDAVIKTMAEFALYGDPSLSLTSKNKKGDKTPTRLHSISVGIPNVRYAVNYSLCSVSEKIDGILRNYIEKNHRDFSDVVPTHYYDSSSRQGQSVYTKDCGEFKQYLKLYYDSQGSVKAHYLSK